MQNGWVKLHRGLLDWEWYDDINTTRLFIHCLLRANHADKSWRGISIKRGSFYSSLDTLTKETGLSISQLRTSFKKLNSTSEVTSKGQATGRMITISNYDKYQADDKLSGKPIANESQANSKRVTTNKNDKNDKNVINKIFSESGMNDDQISEIVRIRKKNKGGVISERVANLLIKEFVNATEIGWTLDDSITEWESRGWKSFKAEWITDKRNPNERHQRSTSSRPDSSAAGRVRQNVAEGIAAAEREIAEIDRREEAMAANEQPLRLQVDKGIR